MTPYALTHNTGSRPAAGHGKPPGESAKGVAAEPESDPAICQGTVGESELEAGCQRRALRYIENKAWKHLDRAYDEMCEQDSVVQGTYTTRVRQEAEKQEATFESLCQSSHGIRGETYTEKVFISCYAIVQLHQSFSRQVIYKAIQLAYPEGKYTWRKLKVSQKFMQSGDIPGDTLNKLREEHPDQKVFLYVDGIIDSKQWGSLWPRDSDDPNAAVDHSNNTWKHAVGVSLCRNEWYEKKGTTKNGWKLEVKPAAHTKATHSRLPILFGEASPKAKKNQNLAKGHSGRYFRSICRVFVFVAPKVEVQ